MRFRSSTILIVAFVLVGLGLEWLKPDDAPIVSNGPRPSWQETMTGSHIRARPLTPASPALVARRARPVNPFLPSAQAAPLTPKPAAKKMDEKKKKTKKKARKATPAAQAPVSVPRAPSDVETPQMSGGIAGGVLPAGGADVTDTERDLQDWRDYVLVEPSHVKTLQLIEAFRAGQISADIFYTLIEEMLSQPAQQTRYFGVIALQATPSPESFQVLEAHYPTETASLTKGLMQAARNEYAEVEKLPILSSVIASAETQMALIALSRARSAVEKLPQTTTTTPVASRNPRQHKPPVRVATGSLSGLQTTLTAVVNREPNTALGREAAGLLELLKRLQNTQNQT